MKSHRVWKRCLEEVVITRCDAFKDVCESFASRAIEHRDVSNVGAAAQQYFEGPGRPERNHNDKVCVFADDAISNLQLQRDIVAQ